MLSEIAVTPPLPPSLLPKVAYTYDIQRLLKGKQNELALCAFRRGIGYKTRNIMRTFYMESPDFPPSRIDCATQFADGDDDDDSGGFGVGRGCEWDR